DEITTLGTQLPVEIVHKVHSKMNGTKKEVETYPKDSVPLAKEMKHPMQPLDCSQSPFKNEWYEKRGIFHPLSPPGVSNHCEREDEITTLGTQLPIEIVHKVHSKMNGTKKEVYSTLSPLLGEDEITTLGTQLPVEIVHKVHSKMNGMKKEVYSTLSPLLGNETPNATTVKERMKSPLSALNYR
ncbi:hypothetical protein G9A89_003831, partial [Geosiphon pyriformis]